MPAKTNTPTPTDLGRWLARGIDYLVHYGIEIILIALILYICISRGLAVRVDIHDPAPVVDAKEVVTEAGLGSWVTTLARQLYHKAMETEEIEVIRTIPDEESNIDDFNSVADTDDPAPHISNLTLVLSPDYGERKSLAPHIIAAKKQRVQRYLNRYAQVARREMLEFGIPASITLAQALLESNAGDSKLAVNSNNHFGIKCRAKCLGCTCRNYGDDTRFDMFRVFTSVDESYREHSKLLNYTRYARLKSYGKDFRKWAHGLRACGYATDKRYGHKLVTIIENLGLDRYDQ